MKPRISNSEFIVVDIKPSRFKEGEVSLEIENSIGEKYYTQWGTYSHGITIGTKLFVYDAEIFRVDKKFPELHGFKHEIIS